MTREVVTVGPATSTKHAAEVMAERGFAALPVVDDEGQVVGIVAEADILRDRLPHDPRLHAPPGRPAPGTPGPPPPPRRPARRDDQAPEAPALLVRGVLTTQVRTVDAGADVSDVARIYPVPHTRHLDGPARAEGTTR